MCIVRVSSFFLFKFNLRPSNTSSLTHTQSLVRVCVFVLNLKKSNQQTHTSFQSAIFHAYIVHKLKIDFYEFMIFNFCSTIIFYSHFIPLSLYLSLLYVMSFMCIFVGYAIHIFIILSNTRSFFIEYAACTEYFSF